MLGAPCHACQSTSRSRNARESDPENRRPSASARPASTERMVPEHAGFRKTLADGRPAATATPGQDAGIDGRGAADVAARACSWRLRTSRDSERSAMTASHAAEAADMVVQYGTLCAIAARRIE